MKVIVTGGSGKAGRYTVGELAKAGHEVLNIDRIRPDDAQDVPFIQLDLSDAGEVYDAFFQFNPDGVCHIAANPSPSGFPRPGIFQNNVMSTYNVMQAAGDAGVTRLVYASSEMATGWLTTDKLPAEFPFDEEDRVPSPNAYATSKYIGEVIADSMVARYEQLTIASLRVNNIILPEDYARFPERRKAYPKGSANFWSYIDVRDVASAFRLALEGKNEGHEVFLIAAAETWLDRPIKQAVDETFGVDAKFKEGHGEYQSAFDCSKMARFFGWKPSFRCRDN